MSRGRARTEWHPARSYACGLPAAKPQLFTTPSLDRTGWLSNHVPVSEGGYCGQDGRPVRRSSSITSPSSSTYRVSTSRVRNFGQLNADYRIPLHKVDNLPRVGRQTTAEKLDHFQKGETLKCKWLALLGANDRRVRFTGCNRARGRPNRGSSRRVGKDSAKRSERQPKTHQSASLATGSSLGSSAMLPPASGIG